MPRSAPRWDNQRQDHHSALFSTAKCSISLDAEVIIHDAQVSAERDCKRLPPFPAVSGNYRQQLMNEAVALVTGGVPRQYLVTHL